MLLHPVHLLLTYLGVQVSVRQEILGFLVACSSDTDCQAFFRHCAAALELIRTFDPERFEQIRRDVRTLALTTRGICYYEHALRAVFFDVDVMKRDPDFLATALVHEATHARLYWSGIRDYAAHADRHERICVAEEIDFASRLPDSDRLVEELRRKLDRPWWNEAGRRAQIRRFAERHKVPQWIEHLLVRFGARYK